MTITVSLMAGKAEVDYDPSRIQPKAIADHIAALGTVDIPTSFYWYRPARLDQPESGTIG
jgi:hypothetical protein